MVIKIAHLRTKTSIMRQFTFVQLLDDTLSRYEQINESSPSANSSTDSSVEECDTVFRGTQTVKKHERKKKKQNRKMLP